MSVPVPVSLEPFRIVGFLLASNMRLNIASYSPLIQLVLVGLEEPALVPACWQYTKLVYAETQEGWYLTMSESPSVILTPSL